MDLWSHVGGRTQLSLEQSRAVAAFDRRRESEIRNLKREILVEKQVLGFHVTMSVAVRVHEVEASQELLEVVASCSFSQAATKGNKVEELTSTDKLKHNELDILTSLLWVDLLALVHFDEADDVLVLELGESGDFSVDQLLERLVRVEDLDGVARARIILGQLDLAGDTAAEGASKRVLIKFGWHISSFLR